MTKNALRDAVAEARRFIEKAEACSFRDVLTYGGGKCGEVVDGGKAAAAMKRASLDLTRALAELRRSQ